MKERNRGLRNESSKTKRIGLFQRITAAFLLPLIRIYKKVSSTFLLNLSFILLKMSRSRGLAMILLFAIGALLSSDSIPGDMITYAGGDQEPPESSLSLEGNASTSTSGSKEQFYTPPQSPESSPNTTPNARESLEFLSPEEFSFWKQEVIRAFHERLAEMDPLGKIGSISDEERMECLYLQHPATKETMESVCRELWENPWPNNEMADRTSIYSRIWTLLEKNGRLSI